AEDGIRDFHVTGVQTCALPIFGKIVSSLVADVIMPPIGLLIGGIDFSDIVVTLKDATPDAAAVTMNIGIFIQTILDFLIIAFARSEERRVGKECRSCRLAERYT